MTQNQIIALMSPTTLASLIADIQRLGTGAQYECLQLERDAMAALVANVGEDEAEKLIEEMT
ncbi:MAG: hypothetical protein ABIH03_05735 [Pseudomonadota bacterium]